MTAISLLESLQTKTVTHTHTIRLNKHFRTSKDI